MPQVFPESIQTHKICHKKTSIRVKSAKKIMLTQKII